MTYVDFKSVYVNYPVYMLEAKRIRQKLLHMVSFGHFGANNSERVVIHALKDISLSLQAGDRLGIVGLNGSGKTTLLQTVAGILEPAHGLRRVKGTISALYNIGLGFDPEANGYYNIKLRGLFMGLTPQEIESIIPDVEEFTELGEFLHLPIRTYSAGMQVRLAFAVATCIKPDILIMDEWIGAGDIRFQERSKARVNEVVASSSLLLLASHTESLIKNNCNKAVLLHHGEIQEYGEVDDVYREFEKLCSYVNKKVEEKNG
jgi:ABC-2 type transport system ATP-binding protein/lipopolysaccharide transport system ATP-binding protein